jgi:hypothetical protein
VYCWLVVYIICDAMAMFLEAEKYLISLRQAGSSTRKQEDIAIIDVQKREDIRNADMETLHTNQ